MNYCSNCVQPDTRPGIVFENGICPACRYEKRKRTINWKRRKGELLGIIGEAKSKNRSYDCVVGVSGGKDSTYQALYARDILHLKTLLVNNEPESITETGAKNIENLINLGFDCIKLRPNPKVVKRLMRRDFFVYLNPIKVTEYSLYASAGIMAGLMNIPLIVQGENPSQTLGDSGEDTGDAYQIYKANTLKDDWTIYLDTAEPDELFMYHYSVGDLKQKGIRAIWLNYYEPEWSPSYNLEFSLEHGLTIREEFNPEDIGTYAGYYQLDNDFVPANQFLKYVKFGFGQCTDHACNDIRAGIITRDEGFDFVKKYDGLCGQKYIDLLRNHLGLTEADFGETVAKFRKYERK